MQNPVPNLDALPFQPAAIPTTNIRSSSVQFPFSFCVRPMMLELLNFLLIFIPDSHDTYTYVYYAIMFLL